MRPPTPRQGRRGRPRQNQGAYDGGLWDVAVVLQVKAPSLREALRRAAAIGVELTEGRSALAPASDLWVRSFRIDNSGGKPI